MRKTLVAGMIAGGMMLPASAGQEDARAAAQRAIDLMQAKTVEWKQGCPSCHHQMLPPMAVAVAREHGIAVNAKQVHKAVSQSWMYIKSIDDTVQNMFAIDPGITDGMALVVTSMNGLDPNLNTAIMAARLARYQRPDGSWATFDGRPPQSGSVFTATAYATRMIDLYMPAELATEKKLTFDRARRFLNGAMPGPTTDKASRLLGLKWAGASKPDLKKAAATLLAEQRPDGGWGQKGSPDSDAYSTGEVLYALSEAGIKARAMGKGVEYLVGTQKPDGSWFVKTNISTPATISPKYFESGFPYGKDQFVSISATALAAMALAKSLPVARAPERPLPLAEFAPVGEQPWMRTALFGSVADLQKALDAGLNSNSKTDGGTTLLMFAANDPRKVKLLLDRGADARALAKGGFDALMVAAEYTGNIESLKMLMAAGLSAKPRPGVRFNHTALMQSMFTGDAGMADLLLADGADFTRPTILVGQVPSTPLSMAVGQQDAGVVRVLVKRGAKVDEMSPEGMTLLAYSVLQHKSKIVPVLLELGADPKHKDKHGLTPAGHLTGIKHVPAEIEAALKKAER